MPIHLHTLLNGGLRSL